MLNKVHDIVELVGVGTVTLALMHVHCATCSIYDIVEGTTTSGDRDAGSLTHVGSTKRQLPANHSLFHVYLDTPTFLGAFMIMQK